MNFKLIIGLILWLILTSCWTYWNLHRSCEIFGFHGGEHSSWGLLGCVTV